MHTEVIIMIHSCIGLNEYGRVEHRADDGDALHTYSQKSWCNAES